MACRLMSRELFPSTGSSNGEGIGGGKEDEEKDMITLWNKVLSSCPISPENNAKFTKSLFRHSASQPDDEDDTNTNNDDDNVVTEYDSCMEEMLNTMVLDRSRISI